MSDHTRMLFAHWCASHLVQLVLAICGIIWLGGSSLELIIISLLAVCLVGGQVLRVAYNRSVRRDRALAESRRAMALQTE